MNPREMTNSNIRKRAKGRKAVRTAEALVNKQANKNRRQHMNKYAHRADWLMRIRPNLSVHPHTFEASSS